MRLASPEKMATFIDRILELLWLEARRRRDHDQIAVDIDRRFVSVQSCELAICRHVHFIFVLFARPLTHWSIDFWNASATATNLTLPLLFMMLAIAPVPRPPAPTNAILISSFPAAWAVRAIEAPIAKPVAAAVPVLRNVRRVESFFIIRVSWVEG